MTLFLVLQGFLALSQEKDRPFFQSSDALGMGDAYTAYAAGFPGPFYNPAGLALKTEVLVKPFDLEVYGSHDMAMFFSGTASNLGSLSNLTASIQNQFGKNYSVGLNFVPQILVKNFSFGVIARGFSEGRLLENSNMELYSFAEVGAYLQTAASFMGGVIKIGGGIKILDRAEAVKTLTPAQYTKELSYGNEWREGLGIGYDAGIILTFPVRYLPRIGLAIQDLANTSFEDQQMLFSNNKSPEGPPRALQQRINGGFAMKIKHGRDVKSMLAAEIKDIGRLGDLPANRTIADYMHAGWELDVRKVLILRAGVNQGRYWTAALGLHVGTVQLDLTSWGENIAFRGESRIDDRKYMGRYSLVF